MATLVKLELSTKQIAFQPDDFKDFSRLIDQPELGDFQVTVVNLSDRFSSFQIELEVSSQERGKGEQWYRVEPDICAKKPPGDRTVFTVTIFKAPVRSYDTTIPIKVRVISIEAAHLTAEDILFLKVQRPKKTLHTYLAIEDLTVYPGDRCKIPVLLYNLSPTARTITARLKGIDPAWLPEGTEQPLRLDSGESGECIFWCAPPAIAKSRHQIYPLLLEASDDESNTASARGTLEVLPFGQVALACALPNQVIPSSKSQRNHRSGAGEFDLTLHNQTNVDLRIYLDSQFSEPETKTYQLEYPATLTLEADETGHVPVQFKAKRPWFGLARTETIEVRQTVTGLESGESIRQIAAQPAKQRLELKLLPLFPLWLQIGSGLLALCLLGLGGWLWPRPHHRAPVTALTLMANGTNVISGSSDQTLRNWQVNPESWLPNIRRLKSTGVLTESPLGKSVRTLRHLPAEVDQLAVGLENGEIQIWDIASRNPIKQFFEANRPDRVFALDFTKDSNFLFSGHGSGQVRLWSMTGNDERPIQRLYPSDSSQSLSFAISTLIVMEPRGRYRVLVAGGQFNRLMLWLWDQKQAFNINYSVGLKSATSTTFNPIVSRQSYLTSLAGADAAALMASADNRGFITLWDMNELHRCLRSQSRQIRASSRRGISGQRRDADGNIYADIDITNDCESAVLDQWQAAPNGQAVRSIALTKNGCYLSSVGDDGRVMLWPLSSSYTRAAAEGLQIQHYSKVQFNAVDIYRDTARNQDDIVLVAHDIPGNRVELHRKQVKTYGCQ